MSTFESTTTHQNKREPVATTSLRGALSRTALVACAALMLIQSSGCLTPGRFSDLFEQPIVDYRDFVWARRAYNLRYADCNREFSDHFQHGFIQGYCDVSDGGDGYVPALPPDEYLGYEYQSAEGSRCVNAWFEGYPQGAAAARKDGAGAFRKVYISKMAHSALAMDGSSDVIPRESPDREQRSVIHPDLEIDTPPKPVTGLFGHHERESRERPYLKLSWGPSSDPNIEVEPTIAPNATQYR